MSEKKGEFCGRTRREFLWESGAGFTGLALSGLLAEDAFFPNAAQADKSKFSNPACAEKSPSFPPKRKA